MFKNINFNEGSHSVSPYDSDVEPKDSTPLRSNSAICSPVDNDNDDKDNITSNELLDVPRHVMISPNDYNSDRDDNNVNNVGMNRIPSFKMRPLSDTPITSNWTSPITSSTVLKDLPLSPDNFNDNNDDEVDNYNEETKRNTQENRNITNSKHSSKDVYPKRRPTTIDVPGLTKSKSSPDGTISKEDLGSKLIIIMVGLPATGKSFITNKLSRYLNYSMYYCQVFNVGNTRRRFAKKHGLSDQDSKFFDPSNDDSTHLRDKWALDTLDELLDYLTDGPGSVGIFDATNTTKKRRKLVLDKIHQRSEHLKVLFLESVCTNNLLLENNIKLKLFGPDYKGKNPESSLRDFKDRLKNYLRAYQPIEDDENIPYIKMIDVGKKLISYKIQGFLASQTVYYLLNFNLAERQIWITRNGESEDNMLGKIGGNSHLTPRGLKFSKGLAKFIDEQRFLFYKEQLQKRKSTERIKSKDDIIQEVATNGDTPPTHDFFVWTSMRTRSIETAQYLDEETFPKKEMKMLDELNAGDYEGMTYPEIQGAHPEEFNKRQKDKLRYRYPGTAGESYLDVINRLRPVITELERISDSALIVTHRVVARALLGYYMNLSVDVIANLDVPLHCVYCLETKPYGITWSLYEYKIDTDSFRKVPETDLNTTTVEEVGLVHRERKYSVVPTAPTTAEDFRSDFLSNRRASISFSDSGVHLDPISSKSSTENIPTPERELLSNPMMRSNSIKNNYNSVNQNTTFSDTTVPYNTTQPQMQPNRPSLLRNYDHQDLKQSFIQKSGPFNDRRDPTHNKNRLELEELNEKLAKLQSNLERKFMNNKQVTNNNNDQNDI